MGNEMQSPTKFLVWCITKTGKEIQMGNGTPMTETTADVFAKSHRGGVGESCGNSYVVRPVMKHK